MNENVMDEMRPKKKRTIILVKKSLQIRFAFITFFAVLVAAALVGWDIYYSINMRMVEDFGIDPDFGIAMRWINHLIITKLVLYSIVIFLISFFISHKFAGPLFRFEQTCEEVGDGDLTYRVNLRKNDELLDLQDKFNLMIDSLQSKVQRIEQMTARIEESGDPHKIKELQAEINKQFKLR